MLPTVVNINGILTDRANAKVSVFDRGFLFGDSLYEVIRTKGKKTVLMSDHLQRLKKSAELNRMPLSQTLETYETEVEKSMAVFFKADKTGQGEAYIRLIITRGSGKIGFGLELLESPTNFVIIIEDLSFFTKKPLKYFKLTVSSRLRNDQRALDPAMKSGNYLNNVLALLAAREDGFDDALLCNNEGHITEGTTFNVFYVRRGIVATPPLQVGILDGITRRKVCEVIKSCGFPLREVLFPKERLYEADEVFITSSLKDVFEVGQIDEKLINQGKIGPVTAELKEKYSGLL